MKFNDPPSTSDRGHVLNPVEMRTLREESPELLWRLIPLFNGVAEKKLAAMRAALQAGDGQTLSECAHTIKGSAANFGAERLMAACQDLENAGNEDRSQLYEGLLDALRVEYEYVAQALKSS